MIGEMTREVVEANTPSPAKQKTTAGSRNTGTRKASQAQSPAAVYRASRTNAPGGAENPHQMGMQEAGQGANAQYTVSQQKSNVSAQYREAIAKEQAYWLELKKKEQEKKQQEEEASGKKEDEEKKNGFGEVDELQRQLDSLKIMLDRWKEYREKMRKKEKNKPKKKVNYSYNRVSTTISRAKSSTQASAALSTASSNLSMVKRMSASGQYEKKDIELALAHAQRMVRTARKKYVNIKFEVQMKKRNKSKESHKKQQVAQVRRPPRKYKAKKELERLKTQLKTQENQEKNKNRRTEEMELMMADMQYIRRKIQLLQSETDGQEYSNPVSADQGVAGEEIMSTVANMESLNMAETAMNAEASAEVAASAPSGGEPVAAPSGGQ